jgi:hypothetical protein
MDGPLNVPCPADRLTGPLVMTSARSSSTGGTLERGCVVEVLAQIPMTAWIRPSAIALTKLS